MQNWFYKVVLYMQFQNTYKHCIGYSLFAITATESSFYANVQSW